MDDKEKIVKMKTALKIAENTLSSFYRILHKLGQSNMADGPDNWVLKIIRDAITEAENDL